MKGRAMTIDDYIMACVEARACVVCRHSDNRLPGCNEHMAKTHGVGCGKFEVLEAEAMIERRKQLRSAKFPGNLGPV